MKTLDEKLNDFKKNAGNRKVRVMIVGLGSVGNYLLDYLLSSADSGIEVFVVGRDREKMVSDVNIVRVSALIRGQCRTRTEVVPGIDLDDISQVESCLRDYQPDIIVNTSRAYPGLKYGGISWKSVRAYGIWAPLAVKYIRNIMQAYENVKSSAIVINSSYSDAVIPWLRSAGMAYPDFGSGNINHLIPRIQYAAAEKMRIDDWWNVDVTYAVSHFHDVVISREGHDEGIRQMLSISYKEEEIRADLKELFKSCKIQMPSDEKRNMMNASSNFEIIQGILSSIRDGKKVKLHCPGAFGEVGGYPVIIDGSGTDIQSYIYEGRFSLEDMRKKNQESIYLDGIEDISGGTLYYTDELVEKARQAFGVSLAKKVDFKDIDRTAQKLITEIIEPQTMVKAL
ncbi:MAG: hypothetical protein K2N87_01130 [Eubacterium sp.]|nr:hypothetical protein [Eubacterium sp.]